VMCYAETVVVRRDVLCRVSCLSIMMCYDELVVVSHGLLCRASSFESWSAMLSQGL
jgi:hypothetical protein